jgi:hypothetical protein
MGRKAIDMTGWIMKEHGFPESRVTVIKKNEEKSSIRMSGRFRIFWDCKCECGNFFTARGEDLRDGHVLSCGCLNLERTKEMMTGKPARNKNDLTGKIFNKLTVLKDSGKRTTRRVVLWLCQCECGNLVLVPTDALTTGHTQSCGCLVSKGEALIQKILIENNITYKKQKSFPDLISENNGHPLYDFYIDNTFLLEYDGIQHYEENTRCSDSLSERQARDKLKNEYAKSHNIPLKRIPYWDFDQITLENIMSDKWLINN